MAVKLRVSRWQWQWQQLLLLLLVIGCDRSGAFPRSLASPILRTISTSTSIPSVTIASRYTSASASASASARPFSFRVESSVNGSGSDGDSAGNLPPHKRGLQKVKSLISGLQRRSGTFKSRLATNFKRLSKRAKMLVVAYLLVLTLILGSLGRSYVTRPSPDSGMANKRPIEITYSSFMDLVEQQQQHLQQQHLQLKPSPSIQALKESPPAVIPKIDNVKIAPDRISFRLSTQPSANGDNGVKYLSAFTRKPTASPELLHYFRQNNLEFTAASNQKNVLLVYALRSAMFTLYGLFLWRMYQTMRGASGQSSSDVPGKLLQQSSRPLASFQDIQGIDDAKNEVMELVDTLRNPDKYAILGARAPTGLLLEGPPGTGKVSIMM
jgi:hypothetical protein